MRRMLGERPALASDPPVVVEIRRAVLARDLKAATETWIVIDETVETDDRDVRVLGLLVELARIGRIGIQHREPGVGRAKLLARVSDRERRRLAAPHPRQRLQRLAFFAPRSDWKRTTR